MFGKVLEIMLFSTIGTILLLLPIVLIPSTIILIVLSAAYKQRKQKGEMK